MIFSSKIVVDPVDLEKVLIVVASTEEEAITVKTFVESENYTVYKYQLRKWHGFDSFMIYVKGNNIKALVEKWPPYKIAKDENWDYKSAL